jgi:hypothetical protein
MKTVPAGTATPDDLNYTKEQSLSLFGVPDHGDTGNTALPNMLQPDLALGAARPEFVNRVLCPDGSLLSDTADMVANAIERATAQMMSAAVDDVSVQYAIETALKVKELQAHIAENRFLFVVDAELANPIYFQCATPGNPDVYPQETTA